MSTISIFYVATSNNSANGNRINILLHLDCIVGNKIPLVYYKFRNHSYSFGISEPLTNAGDSKRALLPTHVDDDENTSERRIDMAKSYFDLGKELFEKDMLLDVIDCLEYSVSLDDTSSEAYFLLGTSYHSIGQLADAERAYQRAIDVDACNAKAHYNLGHVCLDQDRVQGALNHFNQAKEINPVDADCIVSLGLAHKKCGNIHEAIKCFASSIQLDNKNGYALYNLASIYQDLGRIHESIDLYVKVIRYDEHHVDALINLAILYQDLAIKESISHRLQYLSIALRYYERVLAISPDIDDIADACDKLRASIEFYDLANDQDGSIYSV